MVFVLITFTAALVLDLAVLAMLKIGLRDAPGGTDATGAWGHHQPC
ncbi:hypothetical protein JM946_07380 [Steroidobacter sp. S1-65]|uniref:Uncharacterized protein n=1 Tax=Steroidobacter gossypii TaxID=2805490 RepID=A0ABS1WUC1_9GAMM|nr:hypothetical protein [Steroidobacter gossypii]MBM0104563.1 hypothetical protein [Steroidobacter gossypii]